MNRIMRHLTVLLIAGCCLAGCGGGGPKQAAYAYLTAISRLDLQTAKDYLSDSGRNEMARIIEQIKTLPPADKKRFDDAVEKRSKVTVTIQDVRLYGDNATVTYITSENPSRVDSVPMVKQGSKWLADVHAF